jgi:hypothetical protein
VSETSQMPPVLSSSVKGPLGVAHLPRLWLKILLHASGRLPEGYRHGVGGFDEFLTTTLGIDRDAFVAYIETEKPDYLTLERWVRDHATSLDDEAIAKVNHRVGTVNMNDELLAERRARLGLDPSITGAVAVNDIDDWKAFHTMLTSPSS